MTLAVAELKGSSSMLGAEDKDESDADDNAGDGDDCCLTSMVEPPSSVSDSVMAFMMKGFLIPPKTRQQLDLVLPNKLSLSNSI